MRPWHWAAPDDEHFAGSDIGEDWNPDASGTNIMVNTTVNNTAAERRSTACHEIGHALGLGERGTATARANTCMDAQQNLLIPDAHDWEALHDEVYNHSQ